MPPQAHFRSFARQPTKWWVVLTGVGRERRARLRDLGLGGAGLELAEEVPLGASVGVRIDAPHLWDPLFLSARVTWVRARRPALYHAGVAFEAFSPATMHQLVELLASPDPG